MTALGARATPAADANAARNARAEKGRFERWAPARGALWELLQFGMQAARLPNSGMRAARLPNPRVAVVGAGNGDDLPLARLSAVAEVTLLDVDPRAAGRAACRGRGVRVVECDVTDGAADDIVARAARGRAPVNPGRPAEPLPGGPYDLVVGDLFYSQLVYPALVDLGLDPRRVGDVVAACAPWLLGGVVARLHASAPRVVHVHDPAGWWAGHAQPRTLEDVLGSGRLTGLHGPRAWDPRTLLTADAVLAERLWRWPFKPGVDYVVRGTLARTSIVPGAGTRAAAAR